MEKVTCPYCGGVIKTKIRHGIANRKICGHCKKIFIYVPSTGQSHPNNERDASNGKVFW